MKKKNNQNIVSYTLIIGIILMIVTCLLSKFLNFNEIFYYIIVGIFAVLLLAAIAFFTYYFKGQDNASKNDDEDGMDKYVYYISSYIGVVVVSFLIMYLGTLFMSIQADTISQTGTKMGKYLFYGFPAFFLLLGAIIITLVLANLAIKKTSLLKYIYCSSIFAGSAVLIYLLVGIFY